MKWNRGVFSRLHLSNRIEEGGSFFLICKKRKGSAAIGRVASQKSANPLTTDEMEKQEGEMFHENIQHINPRERRVCTD